MPFKVLLNIIYALLLGLGFLCIHMFSFISIFRFKIQFNKSSALKDFPGQFNFTVRHLIKLPWGDKIIFRRQFE